VKCPLFDACFNIAVIDAPWNENDSIQTGTVDVAVAVWSSVVRPVTGRLIRDEQVRLA